jgi:replicative DNA helicase
MEQNTLEVTERSEVFEFTSLREMVNQALRQNFGQVKLHNGITSGFRDLDKLIGGLEKGQLTTIAVKPGMGKTALMLSIANNVAIKNNHSVAIFSSERPGSKITNRLIESETGMSLDKLMNGNMKPSERDHMYTLVNHIAKANIYIDDSPIILADALMKKSRQLKVEHNIELIIIDYLELMVQNYYDIQSRDEQLSKMVIAIKEIARELNVPILLFSQIPGHFPHTVVNKPTIQDIPVYLAEHSDVVLFLHRSDLNTQPGRSVSANDYVELVIGKYNGQYENQVVELRFIESLDKFTDK